MKLNLEQQKKVENNMKLVGKVIMDRVHGVNQIGIYSYEDLLQIGYIGLCKAASTDKGGCFSTYAYKLIWNQICDALNKANYLSNKETLLDKRIAEPVYTEIDTSWEVIEALQIAEGRATPAILKGIEALRYAADGYNSFEIGNKMQAANGTVRMWMTRARSFLQCQPELLSLTENIA